MTMMATQEQTDPSVLLNRKSLKDTMANVDDDDDRSDDIPVVEPLPPQLEDKYGPKTSRTSTADASSSNNYNTMMSMTPPRSSLANDPNLTPIASIKRPRANLNRTNSANRSTGTMMMMSPKTPSDAILRRSSTSGTVASTPLSPMHKIKPVLHRETAVASENHHEDIKDKVDELFSPVVQFLHDHEDSHLHDHSNANNDICNIPHASKSEDVDVTEDDDDESMCRPEQHDGNDGEFNPWQFIASLPPYEMVVSQRPPVTLPPPSTGTPRKTLVLDLDETLVHCSVVEPTDRVADFTFPVQFHGETYTVHVKCRPYLHEFLEMASRHFEVIVFTASQKVYADALLNIIDPNGKCIHHRLFRESCLAVEGNYLKDLNVLGRDLSRTVLVDNSPHAFGYQVNNGIPIESWFDCPDDRELLKLQRFLLSQVLPATDVRVPVRNKFQSHVLIATSPPFHH